MPKPPTEEEAVVLEVERIMSLAEDEVDAEIRAEGGDPDERARFIQMAVDRALAVYERRRSTLQ